MSILKLLIKVTILLSIVFFVFASFLYYNDKFYSSAVKLSERNGYLSTSLDLVDNFYNEIDLNKYISKEDLTEDQVVRLFLSGSDVKMMNERVELFKEVGYIKDELNLWRKARIELKNFQEKVKYKFHGTSISSIVNSDSFSLRIKHKKEGNYRNLMREYSLITYQDDLDISTISINKIASDFGLLSPHGKMVIAKINNVPIGMYMLVEHYGKEWFEKNHQMTNYTILKSNDDWDRKENTSDTAHISNSDNLVNNKEIKTTSLDSPVAVAALKKLFVAIKNNNLESVKEYIDLDYAARFLSMSILANNAHSVSGDNLKYIYDHTSGKFRFLYRIEDTIKPIGKSLLGFNSSWFLSYSASSTNLEVFKILTMDNNFRNLRDRYLNQLVNNKDTLINDAKLVFDFNYQTLLNSKNSLRREKFKEKEYLFNLGSNLDIIRNYLNYNKVFVTVDSTQKSLKRLSILNDSFVSITFRDAYKNMNKDQKLSDQPTKKDLGLIEIDSPHLDFKLDQINTIQEFKIVRDDPITDLIFTNQITGKVIPKKDVYINYINDYKVSTKLDSIESLEINKLDYFINGNDLVIRKGSYKIQDDLIFPKLNIVLRPGVRLLLGPGVSVLFQSDLSAEGIKEDPITVSRLYQDKNFGVFAVIGKEKKAEVFLSNFHLEGGDQSLIEGVKFLGQLSIHNANVRIQNSSVIGGLSDDGMNIRNSNVSIRDSIFEGNFADQIDLDFCDAELVNNIFRFKTNKFNLINDPNGDGLDVSGSKVRLIGNSFYDFVDKALSIGENSKVLLGDNTFNKNFRAITVKDGSSAYVLTNKYLTNNYDFSLYVKKRFYNNPQIFIETYSDALRIDNQVKNKLNSINLLDKDSLILKYESE